MGESSGSVSVDVERISFGGKICRAFKDYFFAQKLLLCFFIISAYTILVLQDMRSVTAAYVKILSLSMIHILNITLNSATLRVLQLGAAPFSSDEPVLSVDQLADQVADVLDFFGLVSAMCFGVTAGAYILTLFASKYRERVLGLILVSPLCKAPSWSEWLYTKVVSNFLYFYGMCGLVKEYLLQRYFSKEVRGSSQVPESDIVQACKSLLDEKQSANVWHFLQSLNGRHDLTGALKKLRCRTLIFVGEDSPFHSEALHMTTKLDRRYSALVEVQACGSVVTEEQPQAMLIPMEYFLMGYGLYRPSQLSYSPPSPLNPLCISPELLSPESMGLKLKPIKTRISLEV
ncbi:hypothetical protein C4D60_Mb10t03430 [Musa balbisiana]|uniref:Pollen-specific protein SF21 n=1 Tax=Musa balbisiana TaxID=52838 RepID=A0A4S8IVQ6_MUSBA|nr:hypothetical protein C4D60_Mb10t03430 [Musa balbisiana]